MPGMMPGMGMMQPPPLTAGDESDVEAEDHGPAAVPTPARANSEHEPPSAAAGNLPEDGQHHHEKPPVNALISRSCTYVKQLPRNRLSETLEAVDGCLDSTFTSELTSNGLLILLWMFCRVKPGVKISDLRDSVWNNSLFIVSNTRLNDYSRHEYIRHCHEYIRHQMKLHENTSDIKKALIDSVGT